MTNVRVCGIDGTPHIHAMSRISINPVGKPIRVAKDDTPLAYSENALLLTEEGYPPRYYIPAADVRIERLRPSDTVTRCPHKGAAEYFHAETDAGLLEDIAWSYPEPPDGVRELRGHLCFYDEKLTVEVG